MMKHFRNKIFLIVLSLFQLGFSADLFGKEIDPYDRKHNQTSNSIDTLSWSVSLLNRIFQSRKEWTFTDQKTQLPIKGVVNYAENDPVDSIVSDMTRILLDTGRVFLVTREAEKIRNKKLVPGYLNEETTFARVEERKNFVEDSLKKSYIIVPDQFIENGLVKAPVIPEGDTMAQLNQMDQSLPGAFKAKYHKGLYGIKLPSAYTDAEMDSIRIRVFRWTRQSYNDSILFHHRDSLMRIYREQYKVEKIAEAEFTLRAKINSNNYAALKAYNEKEIVNMNDSVRLALEYLTEHVAADSVLVTLSNLSGEQARIWTARRTGTPMRLFLKNEQNDSLSVILYNNGKGSLRLIIDDGVKFSRMKETQQKEITFHSQKPVSKLLKVKPVIIKPLVWRTFGNASLGFTQTALSNWAKGGESSLALLFLCKYVANYSKGKFKWDNSAEFRFGTYQTKSKGLEKNDDKIEIQTRVGYSAFKSWYYSAETNFRTQIAKGYKYPDRENPISAFMAPGYQTFSIGMDFKPNKNFSLFLSPFTSKTTFIRDTTLINPKHYGFEDGKTRLWEPGMIFKTTWRKQIWENVTYDTKAEVFNNYRYTLQKFNFDWEQVLIMNVNRFITTRIMAQLIYDYNVTFPVKDDQGKEIDREPKWQFKELFSIGFNYKF